MEFRIEKIAENHIAGFHACLDSVAREQKFLGQTHAPSLEKITAFVRENIAQNHPQFVALKDNRVIGWCDTIPHWADALRHRAGLGMGVLSEFRARGIGRQLLRTTIESARESGIKRIDLEVRADNLAAISLYETFGFRHEGRKMKGLFQQGMFHDVLEMGLVFD